MVEVRRVQGLRLESPQSIEALLRNQRAQPESRLKVIEPGSFLTLHYRLARAEGTAIIDTFDDKPATLSLGTGVLAPAIEARLVGLAEGARASFDLAAGEAFGERNPDLLQRVKRSLLTELGDTDEMHAVGDVLQFPTPDGQGAYAGVVREVGDDWLLFDFNHPLAGLPLTFEVQVIGVL
jgi:FKBP-type peptidyl-prolyl cis-trans isomerase SlpA